LNRIQISIDELRQLCAAALTRKGASTEEAEIVFDDYLDAELRGRTSHGFAAFSVALSVFPKRGSYEVVGLQGSVLLIEGNGDCGHVVARRAVDLALEHLPKTKIMAVGLRNITRFNCPGSIARYAAERGSIALVLEYGGQNFVVPYGGRTAALSTNPIGIAFPGTDPLFILDMATSERAGGYVTLAKVVGETIPSNWGVDDNGQPTSDPSSVVAVNPFGGYKGYGLALAFEILSGALVGVPLGSKGTLVRRGAFIVLIDPTIYGHSAESFAKQVTDFLNEVTSVAPRTPEQAVTYPGQRGEQSRREKLSMNSLSLPATVIKEIKTAGQGGV
jgi:LDH2 family malate/lactate/ureidoglycolate dehydrogenase